MKSIRKITALILSILMILTSVPVTVLTASAEECTHGSFGFTDVKVPSCMEPGYSGDKVCNLCGEVLEYGREIPSSGHKNPVVKESIPATCTHSGYEVLVCPDCGMLEKKDTESAKEHVTGAALGSVYSCSIGEFSVHEGTECGEMILQQTSGVTADHSFDSDGICTECGVSENTADSYDYHFSSFYGGLVINSYTGEDIIVNIPSAIEGIPVRVIGSQAFMSSQVTELTVPDTVVHINMYAFADSYELIKVTIADSVEAIGSGAFSFCEELTEITLPAGLEYIPERSFSHCYALEELDIPDTVGFIGDEAFSVAGIREISLPEELYHIGMRAFRDCDSLTEITIPEGVGYISAQLFSECTVLKKVTLGADVGIIGVGAFESCEKLSDINFPEGLREIKDNAFAFCDDLLYVVFGSGLEKIGDNVFPSYDLWHVWFAGDEDAYHSIETGNNNPGLWEAAVHCGYTSPTITTEIIPPTCAQNGYTKILCTLCEEEANCDYVSPVAHQGYYIRTVPPTCSLVGYDEYYCPDCASNYGENFVPQLPHDGTKVGDYAATCEDSAYTLYCCNDCQQEYREYDETSEPLGHNNNAVAFYNTCTLGNVTEYLCSRCKKISFASEENGNSHNFVSGKCTQCGVSDIFSYYLDDASGGILIQGLNTERAPVVDIPESIEGITVKKIEDWAMDGMGIGRLTLPVGLKYIGHNAFSDNPIEEVILPDTVKYIGNGAFSGCAELKKAVLPDELEKLPERLFENAYSLVDVNIPESCKEIGDHAFSGCIFLPFAILSEGVERIGYGAFTDCYTLSYVYIPESVSVIDTIAFAGDSYLDHIYYGGTEVQFGEIEVSDQWGVFESATVHYGMTAPDCEIIDTRAADCVTDGYSTIKCNVCDEEFSGIFTAAEGHEVADSSVVGNTCSFGDITRGICSVCSQVVYEVEKREYWNHNFNEDGICSVCGESDDFEYRFNPVTSGLYITNYYGDADELVIPSEFEGIPVKSIVALQGSSFTKLVIPEGVTDISEGAFSDNYTMKEVVLPESLETIGSLAFSCCTELEEIVLPSGLKKIGNNAFAGCGNIESIVLPEGLTEIDAEVFASCRALKEIDIHENIKYIGDGAFRDCESLRTVELHDGLLGIGESAFENCIYLSEIEIPGSVKEFGENAFRYCGRLYKAVIGEGVEKIPAGCFSSNDGLKLISLPSTLKEIGTEALVGCVWHIWTALSEEEFAALVIGENNTAFNWEGLTVHTDRNGIGSSEEIIAASTCQDEGYSRFVCTECEKYNPGYCEIFTHYVPCIPHSGELIDSVSPDCSKNGYDLHRCDFCGAEYTDNETIAFGHDCDDVPFDGFDAPCSYDRIDMYYCNRCEKTVYSNGGDNSQGHKPEDGICTVCGVDVAFDYILDIAWGGIVINGYGRECESLVIPEKIEGIPVVGIGSNAFFCSGIKEISLPDTIKFIADSAFSYSSLTSIDIPDGVTQIGSYCFSCCNDLASVELPEALKTIGDGAFQECQALTEIDIPDGVKRLPTSLFHGCFRLERIEIPETVVSFGNNCFSDCYKLSEINFPEALTYIGNDAFTYCESLALAELPEGLLTIGNAAFFSSALEEIIIPDSVKDIGRNILEDCEKLSSVRLPAELKVLPERAFAYCYGLTEIDIPDTVELIGEGAFYGCNNLISVELPEGLLEIGDSAFGDCQMLKEVVIPDSVEKLGERAFYGCYGLSILSIGSGITYIPEEAFGECNILSFLYIAGDLEEIAYGAFSDNRSLLHIWTSMSEEEFADIVIASCNDNILAKTHYNASSMAYTVDEEADATCAEGGYMVISCDECRAQGENECSWFISTSPATSHAQGSLVDYQPPSCTEFGYKLYICDVCGNSFMEEEMPLGHEEGEEINQFTNCTMGIVIEKYCPRCENAYYSTNDEYAEGHFTGEDGICIKCGTDTAFNYVLDYARNGIMINGYDGTDDSVVIPEEIEGIPVVAIDSQAFGWRDMVSVVIPDSVTYIGNGAFVACSKLESVRLPAGLTYLEANVFADCLMLNDIELPDGLEIIGESVFAGCCSLTDIEIPDSVKHIELAAFYGCTSLSFIALPDGLGYIDEMLFSGCSNLNAVYIPASVYEIASEAFYECDALDHIFFGGSEEEFEDIEIYSLNDVLYEDDTVIHCNVETPSFTKGNTVPAGCTEIGYTEYSCDICQRTLKFDIVPAVGHEFSDDHCVNCGKHYFECIESAHPYAANMEETWEIQIPGAEKIYITFSEDTFTEENYDFISIYDGHGSCIGSYSGDYLAGTTIIVEGDYAAVELTSDGGVQYWGFKITRISTEAPDDEEETTEAEETTTEAEETTTEAEETTTEAEETTTEAEETTTEAEETTTEAEETTTETEETSTEAEETSTEAEETTTEAEETTTEAEETTTEAEETTTEAEETTTESEETTTEPEECRHFAQQYWTVVSPATCFNSGLKVILCDVCHEPLEREEIPQREHNMQPTGVVTQGNCKDDGYAEYACAHTERTDEYLECNHTESINTGKNPKNHKSPVTTLTGEIKPTCTTEGFSGNIVHSCCGAVKTAGGVLPIDKNAHVAGNKYTVTKPATCTEKGKEAILCVNCDAVVSERDVNKNASNHTGKADLIKNKKTATCTEKGYTGDTCWSCCGAVSKKGTELAKNTSNHTGNVQLKGNKPASCTVNGYTGDKVYTCCGAVSEKGSTIKATGHSYGQFVVVKEATVSEEGRSERVCSVCKAVDAVAIPRIQKIEVEITEEIKVSEELPDVFVLEEVTAETLAAALPAAAEIVTKDGEKVEKDVPLATGMKIVIKDGDRIVDEKVVVVPFDVDGDAKASAADARLALRESVGLENLEDYQKSAADVDDKSKENNISAADARMILRASVGLEDKEEWFRNNF